MQRGDFVHQDEPTAMPQRPMPWPTWATALHGPFARRTIAALESNHSRYGGCDDATGERHFVQEEGDKIRPGVRGRRLELRDGWRCIGSGRTDGGCGDDPDPWNRSPAVAWRGRNRRRQPGDVLRIRQGKYRVGQGRHAGRMGARLRWLPRLSRLSRLQGLPRLRWLRRWRLLRVVGSLPLVLSQPAFRLP